MEAKPPSFVPMPQHVLPFQPEGVEIVLWRIRELVDQGHELQPHFPQRNVAELSESRKKEHWAVCLALHAMLGHQKWHLTHDETGKPWLHLDDTNEPQALSLSHCERGKETWAAVARWDDGSKTGGIDLVMTTDPRVARVAQRVLSPEEQTLWSGRESWAWATKEAMFKGHGPALAFQTDAILQVITEPSDLPIGFLRGSVRGSEWKGAWTLLEKDLLLVWAQ